MFLAGGYLGEVPKFYGPVERRYCFSCGNEGNFSLMRLRSSILLFFIPVPVKTAFFLVCPYCGRRTEITREQFGRYCREKGFRE